MRSGIEVFIDIYYNDLNKQLIDPARPQLGVAVMLLLLPVGLGMTCVIISVYFFRRLGWVGGFPDFRGAGGVSDDDVGILAGVSSLME